MKIFHLGSGVVVCEEVMHVDSNLVSEYVDYLRIDTPKQTFIKNKDGEIFNEAGYKFDYESYQSAPERFIETLPVLAKKEYVDFVSLCEESIYKAAIEYCKLFPVAAETITWKTRGHIAVYCSGDSIGCHSDAAIPEHGNQISIHNTLTTGLLLSNDYTGGSIRFPAWGIEVRPPAGSIVLYPSTYSGAHEVTNVTSGERVVYLQWFRHGESEFSPSKSEQADIRSQAEWVPNLKNDVGQHNLYQKEVKIGLVKDTAEA